MEDVKLLQSEKESIVVGFTGSLTRENASEAEAELKKLRNENPQGNVIVLDFEKLDYISSAGLRVLLKLQKEESRKIKIFNVNSRIMEVFEDTGFDKMFETNKALKKIDISGMELIGQGANGQVYRADDENIVKVFLPSTPLEDIDRERRLAQEAMLAGISTAIPYSVVQSGDRYGIMFEMIDAGTLSGGLKSQPEKYDELTGKYVELYKQIHNTKGNTDDFISIKDIYHEAIEGCKDHYSGQELSKLNELVDSVPDTDTLIHGDYHPNNIMLQNDELILIDMGDMSLGHPIFDFLATAATQVNLVKLNPEYAEFHTKMPPELITKTWRRLFDTYFEDKDQAERDRIEDQICIFSKLKVALAPVFGRGAGEEIIKASVDDAKQNFLPLIDSLIGAVDW